MVRRSGVRDLASLGRGYVARPNLLTSRDDSNGREEGPGDLSQLMCRPETCAIDTGEWS